MCLSDYWIGCDAKLPLKLKARLVRCAVRRLSEPAPRPIPQVMKAKRPQKQDAAAERAEENDADGGSDGEGPEPAGAEEDELTVRSRTAVGLVGSLSNSCAQESGTSESDNE